MMDMMTKLTKDIRPVDTAVFAAVEDPNERQRLVKKETDRRRRELSLHFDSMLKEQGMDSATLAHNYGLEYCTVYANYRGRPFTLPLMNLGQILNEVFGVSVQMFLLGLPQPVELPRSVMAMAEHLSRLQGRDRQNLVKLAGRLHEQDRIAGTDAGSLTTAQLLRERVTEYADEHMLRPVDVCGLPGNSSVYMRRFLCELTQSDALDYSEIRLGTLLAIALSTGTAVDYFLSPNYLPYAELRHPGSGLPMAFDPHTMAFLEQYLMCSFESQKKLFAEVMNAE